MNCHLPLSDERSCKIYLKLIIDRISDIVFRIVLLRRLQLTKMLVSSVTDKKKQA